MKAFTLQRGMTTLGGVFYPTGYMVLMYPTADDARHAAKLLQDDGFDSEEVSLVAPDLFQRLVADAMDDDDSLPSAGTENDTARRFHRLAQQGHHALIVHAPSPRQSTHLMEVLRDTPITYGQKYRHLIIEDLA